MLKHCRYIYIFLLLLTLKTYATHIVGGEIFYDYLGSNTYKITLKLYRDCSPGTALYDNPATIFIFNSSGAFIDSVEIPFPGSTVVPSSVNNPCFTPPSDVCVEEAIYTANIVLPPIAGGYNIDYQRCCRNNSILNIVAPGDVGSTYMAHIPDPSVASNNSSPRFTDFPPIFICSGVPLSFDHSAFDPDGDSLHYELCDPYTGLNAPCPILGMLSSFGCAVIGSPPPFAAVPWISPYNGAYPISSSPAIAINPHSGFMTGTPNLVGQWVIGVCVSEYRNGVLIDVNKRDFQFNVLSCPNLPVASIPQQTEFCTGYNINFTNNSVNASSYYWNFGDPTTLSDTSLLSAPTYTYPDTGTYTVTLIINRGTLCVDTQTTVFQIQPLLNPSFAAPLGQCINGNSFNFVATGAFLPTASLDWAFGNTAIPDSSSLLNPTNIVYSSPGTYPVTLKVSQAGCVKTHTQQVVIYPKPQALFGVSDTTACVLNPIVFIDSSISSSPLAYQWDLGNGQTSQLPNPVTEYTTGGLYNVSLIITADAGCKDTFQLPQPLDVKPSPVAGFDITPQVVSVFDSGVVMTDHSLNAVTCQTFWGDGFETLNCNAAHNYLLPGSYIVMQVVVNSLGCRDTAYADVVVNPEYVFWIPNAFTPNDNDINETFKPKAIGVHDYTFLIFDRWGKKLFETNDSNTGWDGYYKHHLCKNDVYVYKIFFRDDVKNNFHQFTGKVILIK